MRLDILALLCVVVSSSHGLEWATAEYRPDGRFNRRIPTRNETVTSVTAVITSSLDIFASSLSVASLESSTESSETYQNPIDTVSNTTATTSSSDVSIIAETAEKSAAGLMGVNNLGTITTIRRPTLELPTSSLTRSTKPLPSSLITTTSTSEETSFPTLGSSLTLNGTSIPWNWNTTTSAISLPTETLSQSTVSSPSLTVTNTPSECPPQRDSGTITVTSYSIIHTSTITWNGDPADYTDPFPPISTPAPCIPQSTATGRFTLTFCDSTGKTCSEIQTGGPKPTQTLVFVTTDKNPAVVFPTQTPPTYGGEPDGPDGHESAVSGSKVATPDYGMATTSGDSVKTQPTSTPIGGGISSGVNYGGKPPVVVIVQPGEVIIGDNTIIDDPVQQTSTVVVGGDTFVIDPTRVIGVDNGATLTRPPPDAGGVFVPTPGPGSGGPVPKPTTTTVGGVEVVYSPPAGPISIATIDGTVFTIKPTPTAVVVKGQTITLGPEGIAFPTTTVHAVAGVAGVAGPTQTAVLGGELITAIGPDKVVIEGHTIVYGSAAGWTSDNTLTTVVEGETLLIGPSGIVLHHADTHMAAETTLGGPAAAPGQTKFEIVGGATITQMGLTAVEISGQTFYVGSGATTPVTTVIGGHTLTIGPEGVGMSTWTLGVPYASTTTLMPGAGPGGGGSGSNNNAAMTIPTATASPSDGKDNSGTASLPDRSRTLVLLGVGCLGPLLFGL
ncbi:hypothetical protein GGS26DRAFT_474998 [Hypomontagnella submonticulosa]|nr:hypothetical protein GGS26DRAFT_474998 [Hypomontagnella submonticulosa]